MASIPVHTSSPINPNAPPNPFDGSPSTAAVRYTPATATSTTTAAQASLTPPPPQPGAPAVPQPTSPSRPTNSPSPKTIPAPITCPPQPTTTALSKLSIPTGSASSAPYTAPTLPFHQRHPSLYTPPHLRSTPPASATLPFHTSPAPYSYTHIHTNQTQDLSHPPGYIQSRRSFDDHPLSACSSSTPNHKAYYLNSNHKSRLSILDGQYHTEKSPEDDDDPLSAGSKWMWDTAVKWTKVAGKTLKEGEEGIWRRVNRDMER